MTLWGAMIGRDGKRKSMARDVRIGFRVILSGRVCWTTSRVISYYYYILYDMIFG